MEQSEPNFYYFLYDRREKTLDGVLMVNFHLSENLLYKKYEIKEVTKTEYESMIAFGLPEFYHDAKNFPFFENKNGGICDTRERS